MATTYEQLPAELNISFVKGDEVGVLLTLDGLDEAMRELSKKA